MCQMVNLYILGSNVLKLLIKILIFITIIFALLNLISYVLIKENICTDRQDIYKAIESCKKTHEGKDILILGDSVASQLVTYGMKNKKRIIDLTCNQAMSLAGQYVLLENILKNNKQIKTVCLLVIPNSFRNNLDNKYTHNYFVKPFYTNFAEYLTNNTILKINKKYSKMHSVIDKLPVSRVINVFAIDYHDDSSPERYDTHLSPVSIEYLTLMQNKCNSLNVKFKIYPLPISKTIYNTNKNLSYMRNQTNSNGFNAIFEEYFDKLVVLDDNFFVSDNTHIKPKYIEFVSDVALEYIGLHDVLD